MPLLRHTILKEFDLNGKAAQFPFASCQQPRRCINLPVLAVSLGSPILSERSTRDMVRVSTRREQLRRTAYLRFPQTWERS